VTITAKKESVIVQGKEISVLTHRQDDYISLTVMAGYKDGTEARIVISNWMSTFTHLNIWRYGRNLTILILTVWDTRRLEMLKDD
jgi:hypothetical protein